MCLDRHVGLWDQSHRQEASQSGRLALHFATDIDASDRFEGNTGLELTIEMLALRSTHNLLLFKAGYHLDLLAGNRGPL